MVLTSAGPVGSRQTADHQLTSAGSRQRERRPSMSNERYWARTPSVANQAAWGKWQPTGPMPKGAQPPQGDELRGRNVRKRHHATTSGAYRKFASSGSTESFILPVRFGGALPPMRSEAKIQGQEGCREANERFLPSKYPSILLASSRWMHLPRTLPQIRLTKLRAARHATTKRVYPTRSNRA